MFSEKHGAKIVACSMWINMTGINTSEFIENVRLERLGRLLKPARLVLMIFLHILNVCMKKGFIVFSHLRNNFTWFIKNAN